LKGENGKSDFLRETFLLKLLLYCPRRGLPPGSLQAGLAGYPNFWFLPCSNPEISRFLMLEERLYDRHKPPGETILAWGMHLGRTGEKEQDACITV